MKIELRFKFGDLSKNTQKCIVGNNSKENYHLVHHGGTLLIFVDKSAGKKALNQDTLLKLEPNQLSDNCPGWLKGVPCTISATESFFGKIPNGRFRCGAIKAEVTTYCSDPSDMGIEIPTTKVTLSGSGDGATLISNARKLYYMIRSGKITEEYKIELWPSVIQDYVFTTKE